MQNNDFAQTPHGQIYRCCIVDVFTASGFNEEFGLLVSLSADLDLLTDSRRLSAGELGFPRWFR